MGRCPNVIPIFHHVHRRHDRAAAAAAAGISRGDGSCRRIYRGNGALCHRGRRRGGAARRADRAERLCQASAGRRDLPLPPHDEGMCGAHLPNAGRGDAAALPGALRRMVRGARAVSSRHGGLPALRGLRRAAARGAGGCGHPARVAAPVGGAGRSRRMSRRCSEGAPVRASGADAQYVQLAQYPENAGAQGAPARRTGGASRAARGGARQPAGRMRPYHELPLL